MIRLLALLSLLLWLFGCASAPAGEQEPATGANASSVVAPPVVHRYTPREHPTTPTRLRMAGVDAPVVPVVLDGTTLTPPDDPQVLGWWGKRAGAAQGAALLVGHTVHTGGGALDHLEDTTLGSIVTVSGVAYRVTRNSVLSKTDLAAQAADLFNQTGPHRLVIVTCEDYDTTTGQYASNAVLVADPI